MSLLISLAIAIGILSPHANAQYNINWSASLTAGAGGGDFAPYYISSMEQGKYSSSRNIQAEAALWRDMETEKRFSYGFGIDLIGGYASAVDYERYSAESKSWYWHTMRPSSAWLQQLYGEGRYRCLFLTAGLKEQVSPLLNQRLTSGDLVQSGNSRPMPELRAGFNDFQNIPFTNGWLQIQGEISVGKRMDNKWWSDHYNYYNQFLSQDEWYTYKQILFRTNPAKPLSVTFGSQFATEFGGVSTHYTKGIPGRVDRNTGGFKGFIKSIFPTNDGGESFYTGNHLGAMEIHARYRLRSGHEIIGYLQYPWEDGSGIGKLNGWDGLWGIEYRSVDKDAVIHGALIEYLDFTNQSGPIHFNPSDHPGTTVPGHTSGDDDYYNHKWYNSYAYYGQSIGTPALMAPIYNIDGYNRYVGNALRGIHFGIEGNLSRGMEYRVKAGYRKAWGAGDFVLPEPLHLASVMAEVNWHVSSINGLSVNGKIELDRGNMPANAFGAIVTVKYNGLLKL